MNNHSLNNQHQTAVRRGRPSASNDNHAETQAAAKADRADRVRDMRERGFTIRQIADSLWLSVASINNAIHGRPPARKYPAANDNKVVRLVASNGGCSTTSGMVPVSVARVPTMELPEIYPELAVAA